MAEPRLSLAHGERRQIVESDDELVAIQKPERRATFLWVIATKAHG
jgi:hypothetical protein